MVQRTIALVTDSTCDIPEDLIQQYDITVVPQFVLWEGEAFRDRIDLTPQQFYERLVTDPVYPSSAHPTPGDFFEVYQAAAAEGAEAIVVVAISSAMSGTFNVAKQAAEMVDVPVHVVDAKGPTMSLGWQVLAAARAREAGGDAEAMVAAAGKARASMVQFVYMDSLEYLRKGGRIGDAAQWLGTLLQIKPVICINHDTGLVEPTTLTRTRKRALKVFYEGFFARLDLSKPLHLAVLHGGIL